MRFVQDNQADLSVKRMCELVELPRSSFYAFVNHRPSARDVADEALAETIREIYRRSRNTYGAPRVYGQLRRTGHRVARSRVAWPTRANGLVGAHASKKWRRGRPDTGGLADLLQRTSQRRLRTSGGPISLDAGRDVDNAVRVGDP